MRYLHRRQQSSFVWGFNDVRGTTLSECATTSIFLGTTQTPGQPAAVPPYTFIAYPELGIPTVYPLRLTGTAAPWTNNYPQGTTLMFNIADGNGNSGGIPPEIYTVVAGQSKACLLPASTPTVTMKIDEPGELKTCTVLPIHIEGGQKPYTVTLAVANSSSPSNRTMGINDDTFEWVNQAAPNSTFIVAVSDSKGQYAVTSKLYQSAATGTTDVSCPGQVSRSYNSKDPNGSNSTTTTTSSTGGGGNNNNSSNQGGNNNPQIPLGAIIGIAVGGIALLGLLVFFLCFRRKDKDQRGEKVGVRERVGYHRPPLDHSPDGSQSPLAQNYIGEPVYQDNAHFTPFVLPARESAALSYYGSNPTSATQTGFTQYAPPSSVIPPTKYQRPEDQQRAQSIAWQPNYVYPPPPSPAPTSVYQGIAPTEARSSSYNPDAGPAAAHLSPGQTSVTLRSSVYSDSASRKSTYTVPYPAQSPASERSTFAQGSTETKGGPLPNQPVRPTGGAPPAVYQHEDAGGVVELPPAYRDYTAPSSAPPRP